MYCHRTPPPDTIDANSSLRLTSPSDPILFYTVNERSPGEKTVPDTLHTVLPPYYCTIANVHTVPLP